MEDDENHDPRQIGSLQRCDPEKTVFTMIKEDMMNKAITLLLTLFLIACAHQLASAQSLEGTWVRTITLETECPGLPTVSEDFTDTVTYSEFDQTIELPEQYQNCEIEQNGNTWSLDCTYDQEIELCTYHFTVTGNGGLGEDEYDFQFTAAYTVSGGVACALIPLCVVRGTIHGDRIFATSVDDGCTETEELVPTSHCLFQNSPNPFNPITDIRYQIADNGYRFHITLKIYNVLGQEMRALVDEIKKPGIYIITWDGKDWNGKDLSSGFYFCRLEVNEFTATKCMLMLK